MTSLPDHTAEFLYRSGSWTLPGQDDTPCEGATFHSPRPLFTQHVRLAREEWWDKDSENSYWAWAPRASLCGTCRDNLDILLQMLHATDGSLDWEIRREFGNRLRALATKGWEWFSEHRPADPPQPPQ